ncbi:PREDICTED: uncharacterized protein LOC109211386 [Nicotiana attenuata]|uniref:uncharacterized protein LOC109211386 n=1 Tax=Nicotiana attenuata TaxID=49451 RepID=UPI0009047C4E|nr:PREDICTED: uncharacterized protein LOC109211386 [Nicotiana attenuata]
MVSNQGIEINPDKIKSIEDITVVDNIKVVQRRIGQRAVLGRFISRSLDKSHQFFSLLKKKNDCSWTPEFQQDVEELKRYLSNPPLLHTSKANEQLYLYLAVSEVVASGVLVREEEGTQFPIYYVSRNLGDAETRYDIEYKPRNAIKSQILADFVADFKPVLIPEVEKELLLGLGTRSGWVEAQKFEKVREKEVIDFIEDHIICRFALPAEITCDNERQFIDGKTNKFFYDHKIKKILSTHYHPSGNAQAESKNKTILQNLKKRLTDSKQKWKEVLPEVLWAYRTTSKSSTGETPFSLVNSVEALIPLEVGEVSLRFQYATETSKDEAMATSLNLANERR